jgi:diacylglycerol kinase (ATP)
MRASSIARAPENMPTDIDTDTRTVALIANPDARDCDPEICAAQLRDSDVEVEVFGIRDVDRAVGAGADRVALAGGDGSIAPVAAAAGNAGLPLALIACGTANDFARRLGLPLELSAACALAVRGRRLRALELGWLEPLSGASAPRRPFVNVASAGLPAPAAGRARSWKRRLGPLAYAAGAVAAGVSSSPVECTVECDGRVLFAGQAWQVTVASSGAFGAGSRIEEADPADGILDVVAVEAGPRPGLVWLAYRLRTGALSGHGRAAHSRCHTATLQLPPDAELNVDGEIVPSGGGARFTAQGAAFRLVTG